MAKSDSKKRAEMMAKEWKKSRSTTRSLNDLVQMGLLRDQELGGWRAPEGESYPDPRAGEIVVFDDFFKRGFGLPVHLFFQGLLLHYEIGICILHPNSILLVSTFVHLCKAYVGIEPHFDLFRYLFCWRKKGAVGGPKIAGGVYLNLRDGMKNWYLSCPWNTSLTEWYEGGSTSGKSQAALRSVISVTFREEDQLDGPTRIQRSGVKANGPDRLVTPGWTRGGQEFPRPTSDALSEKGACRV